MEKVIKKEFTLSKRKRTVMTAGVLVFFIASVLIFYTLYTGIRTVVMGQAISSITNISELNADSVTRAIENRRKLLETFAAKTAQKEMTDRDAILAEMAAFVDIYEFYSLGILEEDMTLRLTNGAVLDVSGWEQFETAWKNEFQISESYMPANGGEYAVNLFTYPVYFQGKLQYMLISGYYSNKLTERMNISSISGKGYNFLLNSKGEVAIYPRMYEDRAYNGLMKFINDTSEVIPKQGGDRYFVYKGESYYAHFQKIPIRDWYLMICAKERDVFADANVIANRVFAGMGLLWIMVIVATYATVYSIYKSKQDIRRAVFYDKLLGIGNGECLPVVYKNLSEEAKRNMALVMFDIDKFKEFNYIYGEACGDALLKYIVRAIHEELPGDELFRYLADHFVILVDCDDREQFIEKMERVLRRFSMDIDAKRIQPFDISAGVRRIQKGDTLRIVMSDALIAKGTIKGIQVQQYAFYNESIRTMRMNYMAMESDFSRALREKEFHVYYQPKYHMQTEEIIGAEALVRWVKKDGTIVSPGEFIPCFETSRQIIMLDEFMLEEVCRQMKEMEKEGLEVKQVSVNLSRVHLRHHGILPKIQRILKSSDVDPAKISFEITESALYEDSIPLKQIVDFLHTLGCEVDMDDYGIGVSSPNALAKNAFDVVKMDKTFVDGIGDEKMEAVIRSTIQLSKELGIGILAEGVEEKYQAERLVEWGCVLSQGFYYSPPVPEKTYKQMLRDAKKDRK